ncbi:alpha-1,3-mannosyltransferase [Xylariaceae sp. FL0594]|nr:alpha-1,3-mannosyltransferase [Xylariaceae sp. FL0594]
MGPPRTDQTSGYQAPLPAAAKSGESPQTTSNKEKTGQGNQVQVPAQSSGSEKKPKKSKQVERPDLQADLDALFSLHPDELNKRGLLRPITEGGAERMAELGLRTRAYKKYFAAWEKLHLFEDEATGELHIRDNVLQQLYSTAGSDPKSISAISNTIKSYETFRGFLSTLARILFPFTSPYFADHMTLHAQFKNAGRGIVLTAGDDQSQYLLTTIYTFRKLGCDLPIEIMYLGDSDLGEDHRFELEALPGVTTRDISLMVDDEGWKLAGWAIKPFAMLMSSFREVIFIDADSLFFKNPAILFEDPDYVKTGALFFRDRVILPESKRKWLLQVLPRPIHKLAKESTWWTGESGHYQESGVVVVDKWRHFISMLLVCRFNGSDRDGRDGKTGVYEMMHGDKETFWLGFLLAGDPSFAFHKGAVGALGAIQTATATDATANETNAESAATSTSTSTAESKTDLPAARSAARAVNSKSSVKDEANVEAEGGAEEEDESEDEKEEESHAPTPRKSTITPGNTNEQKRHEFDDPKAQNATICSSQLLHLDHDGSPLWFNGWLLVSKFAEKSHRKFAPMGNFITEPRPSTSKRKGYESGSDDVPLDDFWNLTTDNMCCLTTYTNQAFDLSERDTQTLEMIRRRAAEIGI